MTTFKWWMRCGLASGLLALVGCGPPIPHGAALPRYMLQSGGSPPRALSYLSTGDDSLPRVIYVHGTPGSATDLDSYLRQPVPGLQPVAVDRLGFGQSLPGLHRGVVHDSASGKQVTIEPAVVTSFHDQAAAIAPLLVERQGRYPILVGHSLGGPIVAQVAAEYPDRVSGLVILAGSLDPSLEKLHWYNDVARWWILRPLIGRAMLHANQEVLAAKAEEEKLAPLLGLIRCPVIIVQGTKDELVPYANALYTQKMLTHSAKVELISIPGANHFLPWLQADAVRAAVAELRDRK